MFGGSEKSRFSSLHPSLTVVEKVLVLENLRWIGEDFCCIVRILYRCDISCKSKDGQWHSPSCITWAHFMHLGSSEFFIDNTYKCSICFTQKLSFKLLLRVVNHFMAPASLFFGICPILLEHSCQHVGSFS